MLAKRFCSATALSRTDRPAVYAEGAKPAKSTHTDSPKILLQRIHPSPCRHVSNHHTGRKPISQPMPLFQAPVPTERQRMDQIFSNRSYSRADSYPGSAPDLIETNHQGCFKTVSFLSHKFAGLGSRSCNSRHLHYMAYR